MSYDADWVLPPAPDHYWTPGCCDRPHAEHEWSEAEQAAYAAWAETEPGLRQRLARRQAALTRLIELGAGGVIVDNQRRLVREIEQRLAGIPDRYAPGDEIAYTLPGLPEVPYTGRITSVTDDGVRVTNFGDEVTIGWDDIDGRVTGGG